MQTVGAQAAFAPKRHLVVQMAPKVYAKKLVANNYEYACLVKLWKQESNWNPKALNKSSGAFGIAQFLPSTWSNYKMEYKPKSPYKQIRYGLHYIKRRYSTPCRAWNHERRYGWY